MQDLNALEQTMIWLVLLTSFAGLGYAVFLRNQVMREDTGTPELLKVWAHELGFALVPVMCDRSKHHELSVFEAMMLHNIKSGKANKAVYDAYEDGVVTPQEYEEIHQLTMHMIELATAVDQAALKQMQKYTANAQKEKA